MTQTYTNKAKLQANLEQSSVQGMLDELDGREFERQAVR
jgi:hypothetical protein